MKNLSSNEKEKLYEQVEKLFWGVYARDTATLSNTCRQLALGEGGICWVIISSSATTSIPMTLVNVVLFLLVIFFLFDVTQYLFSSIKFKNLAIKYNELISTNVIKNKKQLTFPDGINTYSNRCFILKITTLFIASFLLIYLILIKHPC
jgi:hypothetical protein